MFSLPTATSCTLENINTRSEKFGGDDVLAVDIKLSMHLPNSRLGMFDEGLLDALYLPVDTAQATIVDAVQTELRCPSLDPVSLSTEVVGRDVQIERATTTLTLPTCKVGKFVVRPMAGGSCEIAYRVQCSNVAPELVGELCGMLKREISVVIVESKAPDADPLPHDSTEAHAPGSTQALDATQEFLSRIKGDAPAQE